MVFTQLEWNEPQWSEKLVQCSTLIQQLKSKLQDRETRIALVLFQEAGAVIEDTTSKERSQALGKIMIKNN